MATQERVQNVRINFITGANPDLAKAESLLTKTQQATDKLNQSVQQSTVSTNNLGNAAAKSLPQFTTGTGRVLKDLDSMNIRLKELKTLMSTLPTTAKNKLAQYSAEYKKLDETVKSLNRTLFQQDAALKQSVSNIGAATGQFNNLYKSIQLIVTAGITREIVEMSLSLSRLAGNTEAVGRAFQKQIPNSTSILSDLRRATQGTVTDFELMQRTLQAANFGIDVQELPKLLEFAAVRAQQTGQSVDYLVNSIVLGIGRKSIQILDNLGISANRLKEEFGGTSIRAASIADATRVVGKIAGEELGKMGGSLETAATKVDQLNVSWQKLRTTISQAFIEGNIPEVLKEFVDSFQVLIEARQRDITVGEIWEERQRQQIAIVSANEFIQRRFTKNKEENVKVLEDEIQALTRQIGEYARARDATEKTIKFLNDEAKARRANVFELNDEFLAIEKNIKIIKEGLSVKESDALIDQEILRILQARLISLKEEEKLEIEQLGRIEEVKEQITDLQDRIEKFRGTDEGLARLNQQLFVLQGTLHDLEKLGLPEFKVKDLPLKPITDATEHFQRMGDAVLNVSRMLQDVERNIDRLASGTLKIPIPEFRATDFIDRLKDEFTAAREELAETSLNIVSDQLFAVEQAELQSLQNQLSHLREFYDEQQILAGDNERAKDQLRIEEERKTNALRQRIADKEKKVRRFSVILDTAAGIMRAFATAANIPQAIIQAAIVAAQGISQLAIVNRTPARFAKGVIDLKGPGTTTSDSIPARLSRRESVMTAEETIRAKGILTDIRAKRLDDRIMANMRGPRQRQVTVFNDERIISELKEIRKNQPDLIQQYGALYSMTGKGTSMQKRIRAKRING